MPLFDQEKMAKLVSELRKSVERLRVIATLRQNEFLNDPDKIGSAKYHFIVAIESCIDMCNHVISLNGYRVPEDYADTFQVIGEVGALDMDFTDELRNMAKFRNRLVHITYTGRSMTSSYTRFFKLESTISRNSLIHSPGFSVGRT